MLGPFAEVLTASDAIPVLAPAEPDGRRGAAPSGERDEAEPEQLAEPRHLVLERLDTDALVGTPAAGRDVARRRQRGHAARAAPGGEGAAAEPRG